MHKDYWLQKLVTGGDLGKKKENFKIFTHSVNIATPNLL
jgi:hypothetical protein